MTRLEAFKRAIDGEKVAPIIDVKTFKYIYFDDNSCSFKILWKHGMAEAADDSWDDRDWEIVANKVDFNTAWKAYEEGYTIKSEKGYRFNKSQEKSLIYMMFPREEIRGEWIIENE